MGVGHPSKQAHSIIFLFLSFSLFYFLPSNFYSLILLFPLLASAYLLHSTPHTSLVSPPRTLLPASPPLAFSVALLLCVGGSMSRMARFAPTVLSLPPCRLTHQLRDLPLPLSKSRQICLLPMDLRMEREEASFFSSNPLPHESH